MEAYAAPWTATMTPPIVACIAISLIVALISLFWKIYLPRLRQKRKQLPALARETLEDVQLCEQVYRYKKRHIDDSMQFVEWYMDDYETQHAREEYNTHVVPTVKSWSSMRHKTFRSFKANFPGRAVPAILTTELDLPAFPY